MPQDTPTSTNRGLIKSITWAHCTILTGLLGSVWLCTMYINPSNVREAGPWLLGLFGLAALLSWWSNKKLLARVTQPLADLTQAVNQHQNHPPSTATLSDFSGLSMRSDEIGRLSFALQGMLKALYDRIEINEAFAADVTHEIRNPLASLRSAVDALRRAARPDHKKRLMAVIDHDVQRLDRLISDIASASRLDSELVRTQEEELDLIAALSQICETMGAQARELEITFSTDFLPHPVKIQGIHMRLAQVFVNLIANATSFCEAGDAIRVWCRIRERQVLIVVEDTGPGISEASLSKIFNRFYSERPGNQFGENSGLGLSISKQIIEAHGGVIWAENIRPSKTDLLSEPLGARFIVGLPLNG